SSRLEALLLALSSSHGLMRILCPIILPEPLLMRTGQSETAECCGVGTQFVGDQQFRREAVLLEQLAHQPQRRPAVAPALDKQVEDLALVIDGPPEVHPLPGDPHHQSRPNANDRSAEGDAGAAVARSPNRTSAPSAAPFRKRCRARARPAVPRH